MGVEEFFKQEEERFIRDNLMSDEVLDFIRENTLPFNRLMAYYRCAIMEVETKFKVLNEQFSLQYDRNPIESIKTRIKSTEGIIKKANKKKIPFTMQAIEENIRDIAGIRVICSFSEDIYMLADCLLKQDDIRLVEMKDYIKHPKESGYRSLHVIIEIPIFLQNEKRYMKVEVQLRTIAMDFWASVEHKLRYKKNIPDSEAETLAVELSSYADQLAELDNKIETKDNEEEKTVVKDNKKVEEKPIENEECEYQENFTDDNVEEEECEYQENFSDANDQENSEEECEYQENFSNTNEGNLNKFTLYEQNFDIPVSSGYSVRYKYVEVDLVNKTATLKEHVDILDNTEEDDYDYVINVKKLSDSEAKLLGDIYYQMVVIDPVSSSDLVREMIGIDDGWDYENETWDEYKERITVYSTNYNGETLYIYGVDWIRMLSYLFEE